MVNVAKWFPYAHFLFMKIAEPRVTRLLHFGIYICLLLAGIGVMITPPPAFQYIIGHILVYVFGGFIFIGGALSSFAVLPGIWWLERVGLVALSTGMFMYLVILTGLNPSPVSLSVSVAFILTFILRWLEIKDSQLAPREA